MGEHKSWFNTVVGELAAAAHEHQPTRLRDDTLAACRKAIDEHDLERAVIEAAKAVVQEMGAIEPNCVRDRYLSYTTDSWPDLRRAVEALQEAEGG